MAGSTKQDSSPRGGRWARLRWPTRTALVVAGCVAAALIAVSVIALIAVGTLAYGRFDEVMASWDVLLAIVTFLPLWALLYIVDFAIRGVRWAGRFRRRSRDEDHGYAVGMHNRINAH